jgi:hypothetical protein
MNLYVWEGFHTDWYPGLAFAVAPNLEEARKAVSRSMDSKGIDGELVANNPLVYRLDGRKRPVAFHVYGGG